ncbi:MAG: hypothetical protein QOK46_306, partial [Microbacteriaceae bacterium]|nr:hypothetical protein [Microbacteriaceae bacterium]
CAAESTLGTEPGKLLPLIAVGGRIRVEVHLFRY